MDLYWEMKLCKRHTDIDLMNNANEFTMKTRFFFEKCIVIDSLLFHVVKLGMNSSRARNCKLFRFSLVLRLSKK